MSPEYAGRLALLVHAAAGVIRAKAPSFGDVQAWPTLLGCGGLRGGYRAASTLGLRGRGERIDGNGTSHVYRHDYSILIDRGGNNTYDNNAGGNLQDIKLGPSGSAASRVGPAIGCEQVQGNFPAPTASAHDCIAAPQVVLIDQKSASKLSNDTYGVFKSPRTVDHNPLQPDRAR